MPLSPKFERMTEEHQYQAEQSPFLYPTQPTVCSCGMSPRRRPDNEILWWGEHFKLMLNGHEHTFEATLQDANWELCTGCNDARKVH